MNTKQIYLPWLCAFALAAPFAGQDVTNEVPKKPRVYDRSELSLIYHDSQLADTSALLKMLDRLYGRNILVKSMDGSKNKYVDNLFRYGKTIVIYETPEAGAELRAALLELETVSLEAKLKEEQNQRRMDHAFENERAAMAAQLEPIVSYTYSPRFISDAAARRSLSPYSRYVQIQESDGSTHSVENLHVTDTPTTLVIRDTQANIDKMTRLLREIDRPLPQITLSAYILSPSEFDSGSGSGAVPKELSENLAKLTPFKSFNQLAMSSIRTSVGRGNKTLLTMKGNGLHFSLELSGLKYDEQSGTLAINSASLNRHNTTMISPEGPIPPTVELQTSFSTLESEYAVIGFTGINEKTILLAVRFQALASGKKRLK